jgi:hypothetical protein
MRSGGITAGRCGGSHCLTPCVACKIWGYRRQTLSSGTYRIHTQQKTVIITSNRDKPKWAWCGSRWRASCMTFILMSWHCCLPELTHIQLWTGPLHFFEAKYWSETILKTYPAKVKAETIWTGHLKGLRMVNREKMWSNRAYCTLNETKVKTFNTVTATYCGILGYDTL